MNLFFSLPLAGEAAFMNMYSKLPEELRDDARLENGYTITGLRDGDYQYSDVEVWACKRRKVLSIKTDGGSRYQFDFEKGIGSYTGPFNGLFHSSDIQPVFPALGTLRELTVVSSLTGRTTLRDYVQQRMLHYVAKAIEEGTQLHTWYAEVFSLENLLKPCTPGTDSYDVFQRLCYTLLGEQGDKLDSIDLTEIFTLVKAGEYERVLTYIMFYACTKSGGLRKVDKTSLLYIEDIEAGLGFSTHQREVIATEAAKDPEGANLWFSAYQKAGVFSTGNFVSLLCDADEGEVMVCTGVGRAENGRVRLTAYKADEWFNALKYGEEPMAVQPGVYLDELGPEARYSFVLTAMNFDEDKARFEELWDEEGYEDILLEDYLKR